MALWMRQAARWSARAVAGSGLGSRAGVGAGAALSVSTTTTVSTSKAASMLQVHHSLLKPAAAAAAAGCGGAGLRFASTMRAIDVEGSGRAAQLKEAEDAIPEPQGHEVRIKVQAAGVNRPDIMQKRGLYPAPAGASPRLGLEVAGYIEAVGEDVRLGKRGLPAWNVGDAVCALTNGGGYAEYVTVHASHCLPMPKGMSFLQAAALPETTMTVWHNVFAHNHLLQGSKILIHGGGSGIGTTCIQLAKSFGVEVFVTAGSRAKMLACTQLGAQQAFNYKKDNWVEKLREQGGVDMVLDMIGAPYFQQNLSVLRTKGELVMIGFQGGSKAREVDLMRIMLKRLTVTGSTLRSQTDAEKARLAVRVRESVWPMIARGEYSPLIYCQFPLHEAEAAHQIMENLEHVGKIILNVDNADEVPISRH